MSGDQTEIRTTVPDIDTLAATAEKACRDLAKHGWMDDDWWAEAEQVPVEDRAINIILDVLLSAYRLGKHAAKVKPLARKKSAHPDTPAALSFVLEFHAALEKMEGMKPPPSVMGRDIKMVRPLIGHYGREMLTKMAEEFFRYRKAKGYAMTVPGFVYQAENLFHYATKREEGTHSNAYTRDGASPPPTRKPRPAPADYLAWDRFTKAEGHPPHTADELATWVTKHPYKGAAVAVAEEVA